MCSNWVQSWVRGDANWDEISASLQQWAPIVSGAVFGAGAVRQLHPPHKPGPVRDLCGLSSLEFENLLGEAPKSVQLGTITCSISWSDGLHH